MIAPRPSVAVESCRYISQEVWNAWTCCLYLFELNMWTYYSWTQVECILPCVVCNVLYLYWNVQLCTVHQCSRSTNVLLMFTCWALCLCLCAYIICTAHATRQAAAILRLGISQFPRNCVSFLHFWKFPWKTWPNSSSTQIFQLPNTVQSARCVCCTRTVVVWCFLCRSLPTMPLFQQHDCNADSALCSLIRIERLHVRLYYSNFILCHHVFCFFSSPPVRTIANLHLNITRRLYAWHDLTNLINCLFHCFSNKSAPPCSLTFTVGPEKVYE